MCGRAAQTLSAVQAAANTFRIPGNVIDNVGNNFYNRSSTGVSSNTAYIKNKNTDGVNENSNDILEGTNDASATAINTHNNNFNMSPGMDAVVFWIDHTHDASAAPETKVNHVNMQMKRMTWGLLSQNGTTLKPLEKGMNKHFANLMYNARSDTLYEKVTFHSLCSKKQSCIVALKGYFEWKTEMGKKQPYFVYRNSKSSTGDSNDEENSYLLLAGLWKRTATGWPDQSFIDTFTILTTEVCPPIQWLHTRMPVLIWDNQLAIQWLNNPSSKFIHEQLVHQSQLTTCDQLQWHKVTTFMSSMKFRTIEAILPYKEKQQSVKSYFTKSGASPTPKRKDKSKDDVEDKQDPVNDVAKKWVIEAVAQEPTARATTKTLSMKRTRETKKQKVGDDNITAVGRNSTPVSSPQSKKSVWSSPSIQPNRITSSNTRTIDSFFTPKSTRK